MNKLFFCAYLLFTFVSCTQTQVVENYDNDFVWIQDSSVIYSNLEDMSRCLDIPVHEFGSYIVIEEDQKADSLSLEELTKRMHDVVSRKVVFLIKQKMQFTFKKTVYEEWLIEEINIPVKYRMFRKREQEQTLYRYIAVYKKKDMEINRLLQYLPYQYKKPFLDEIEKKMKTNRDIW